MLISATLVFMLCLDKSVSTSCFSDRWYPSLRVRCARPAKPTRRSRGRSGGRPAHMMPQLGSMTDQ